MKVSARLFIIIFIFPLINACSLIKHGATGSYYLNYSKETRLKLNQDRTFEYLNYNPLLIFKGENYQISSGIWQETSKSIKLKSDKSSLNYKQASIKRKPFNHKNETNFVFFDLYGDTVNIYAVKIGDSLVAMNFHKLLPNYKTSDKEIKQKEHIFYFVGYKPFSFINNEEENADFDITLFPEINPNSFNETYFKLYRNRLINKEKKYKFIKLKELK